MAHAMLESAFFTNTHFTMRLADAADMARYKVGDVLETNGKGSYVLESKDVATNTLVYVQTEPPHNDSK